MIELFLGVVYGLLRRKSHGTSSPKIESSGKSSHPYQRVVYAVTVWFAVAGFCTGLVFAAILIIGGEASDTAHQSAHLKIKAALAPFILPFVLSFASGILGVVVTCAVAPRSFFTSPSAYWWMQLIGTHDPSTARAVCWIALGLLVAIPAFWMLMGSLNV